MAQNETALTRRAIGIEGLDAVTHGGLPDVGGVLVLAGPGCGKTVLGLQILAQTIPWGDGGLFVSSEESPAQIRRDAGSFEWGSGLIASDAWAIGNCIDSSSISMGAHVRACSAATMSAAYRCEQRCRVFRALTAGADARLYRKSSSWSAHNALSR